MEIDVWNVPINKNGSIHVAARALKDTGTAAQTANKPIKPNVTSYKVVSGQMENAFVDLVSQKLGIHVCVMVHKLVIFVIDAHINLIHNTIQKLTHVNVILGILQSMGHVSLMGNLMAMITNLYVQLALSLTPTIECVWLVLMDA